jgi:hypothetical protein
MKKVYMKEIQFQEDSPSVKSSNFDAIVKKAWPSLAYCRVQLALESSKSTNLCSR